MEKIENARITKTSITMADHGCLTFWIFLEGGGWGCGFGGYCIGHGFLGSDTFKAENGKGLEAMMHIMNVVGVEKWEDLEGKYVRCKVEGISNPIHEIGNVLNDEWFNIKEFFAKKAENHRSTKEMEGR